MLCKIYHYIELKSTVFVINFIFPIYSEDYFHRTYTMQQYIPFVMI